MTDVKFNIFSFILGILLLQGLYAVAALDTFSRAPDTEEAIAHDQGMFLLGSGAIRAADVVSLTPDQFGNVQIITVDGRVIPSHRSREEVLTLMSRAER